MKNSYFNEMNVASSSDYYTKIWLYTRCGHYLFLILYENWAIGFIFLAWLGEICNDTCGTPLAKQLDCWLSMLEIRIKILVGSNGICGGQKQCLVFVGYFYFPTGIPQSLHNHIIKVLCRLLSMVAKRSTISASLSKRGHLGESQFQMGQDDNWKTIRGEIFLKAKEISWFYEIEGLVSKDYTYKIIDFEFRSLWMSCKCQIVLCLTLIVFVIAKP